MTVPSLTLHDQTSIPQLGFGVFQVPPEETEATVLTALGVGYRHIDTAQMYGNEAGVGRAIATSDVPREELYITTKLNNSNHRPDDVRRSFEESRAALGLEQVDLFLVHWPLPTQYDGDLVSTWQAMADLVAEGGVRSVGVSNFQAGHLEQVIEATGVVPVVNQVEAHPYFRNDATREASRRHGVEVEAWSPIAQGAVLDDPVITEIARSVDRTPPQVTLRWHVERGDIVFPKTMHEQRMRENLDIFDFTLTAEQVEAISALDRGEGGRRGPHPDTFDWIPG